MDVAGRTDTFRTIIFSGLWDGTIIRIEAKPPDVWWTTSTIESGEQELLLEQAPKSPVVRLAAIHYIKPTSNRIARRSRYLEVNSSSIESHK